MQGELRAQDRLDVNLRRAFNCVERTDAEAAIANFQHVYLVKAEGIRAVRRARRKNTSKRRVLVRARMHLQDLALRLMQPGDQNNFLANDKALHSRQYAPRQIYPRVRCSFISLLRSAVPVLQR